MSSSKRLTEEQGELLLLLARMTIARRLGIDVSVKPAPDFQKKMADPAFAERRGTFVTLKQRNMLRGCIGCLTPSESIVEGVKRNALNAAFNDNRFMPVTNDEYDDLQIEVSILTEPQGLSYDSADDLLRKLRPGIDGVILKKGYASATFLPQVWEQLPRPKDFLAHLCMKAGLPADAWKTGNLEISTYQVQKFEEA